MSHSYENNYKNAIEVLKRSQVFRRTNIIKIQIFPKIIILQLQSNCLACQKTCLDVLQASGN